ncbi:MAG: NAD(P)H-hydrate dehydratase [Bacteroidota bacterium]|nr:NAD(P)H-hydrate dehydratase [Candidatus Kapabacteria bacterium]MDW8219231.1 NAD(P)H-hydrate dehydratase [Bacteroidota bacterium]
MRYILTPEQMRDADAYAMHTLKIPPSILMENAARATFDYMYGLAQRHKNHYGYNQHIILVLCGSGNNGGDGFAVARHFSHYAPVHVIWVGAVEKMSDETRLNFELLQTHHIPTLHCATADTLYTQDIQRLFSEATCVLDALIGNSGTEHVRSPVLDILRLVKATKRPQRLDIALDIPTGLHAGTGIAHPDCFRADATITIAAWKTGLVLNDAPDIIGQCTCVSIGIPEAQIRERAQVRIIERHDVEHLLPTRPRRSTKHDYGSVTIIGGTSTMTGAPALAAHAAIAAGAGLVHLYAPRIHPMTPPEVILHPLPHNTHGSIARKALPLLSEALHHSSVIVIGPGLGTHEETLALIRDYIHLIPPDISLVLDADALRALRMPDNNSYSTVHTHTVITPHQGEFARLTNTPYETIPEHAHTLAREWAARLGCTIVLKSVPTIISNGQQSYWNTSGNAGMASAGSGDVLAGIIASMLAQRHIHHHDFLTAVALAVYCHGCAGNKAAQVRGQLGVTATSIIAHLPDVFPQYHDAL